MGAWTETSWFGFIALILAAVMAVAGLGTRKRGRAWVTALIASVFVLGLGIFEFIDVTGHIADSAGSLAVVQVGIGLWLLLAGGVIGVIASLGARSAR